MASDTVVRARIDAQVKERAAKVLADMGLSVSDAIRLLLVRVAAEKAMPFEIKVPKPETRAAIAELENGAGKSFDSVAELMADLSPDHMNDRRGGIGLGRRVGHIIGADHKGDIGRDEVRLISSSSKTSS
jgi:DNA-damage-inducible protein J